MDCFAAEAGIFHVEGFKILVNNESDPAAVEGMGRYCPLQGPLCRVTPISDERTSTASVISIIADIIIFFAY